MSPQPHPEVTVRAAKPDDSFACGQICYDAFSKLSAKHSFPSDVPDAQTATSILSMLFSSPGFYCVVAESEGRIVGSNCLDERSLIAGIGPITVDPGAQNLGVGPLHIYRFQPMCLYGSHEGLYSFHGLHRD